LKCELGARGTVSAFECPSCEAAFDSRRGLDVQHSRVHDERLPNRICDRCDVELYPADASGEIVDCSEECRPDWLSTTVACEGHPNWKGGDIGPCGPRWNDVRRPPLQRDGHECVRCGETAGENGRSTGPA
jgi:hypothetical protein